ncbi:MAG: 5'-methylthioadenosine nucleosidase [Pseudomonadota bacterium]
MSDILVFIALEDECAAAALSPHRVVYTGVGKVNAAIVAATALAEARPRLAINYGTAGAVTPGLSGLIECGAAAQRDMDLRPLGLAIGETFGEGDPSEERWAPGPLVGTGDSFADGAPDLPCDLVDMEAFALARACRRAGAPFRCLKYVTDAADESAAADWSENKARGAALFADWLKAI